MNWVDLAILAIVLIAGMVGYRVGLLTRALSWLGLAAGVCIGIACLGSVLQIAPTASARVRVLIALAFITGIAILGQTIGLALASLAASRTRMSPRRRQLDRVFGAVIGVIGVLVAVWLITPLAEQSSSDAPREVRESTVVRALTDVVPNAPDVLGQASDSIRRSFPELVDRARTLDAGPPPIGALPQLADAVATASTVKVEGEACGRIQDGSGFVAATGLVVTNAHVVAGERSTSVIDIAGKTHRAILVAFDPVSDLAVLRVPTLAASPLILSAPKVDATGVVYGFPGGGALTRQPSRVASIVESSGKDIYGNRAPNRQIMIMAAALAPGDSGGPLVLPDGTVGGVAFAIDPERTTTAYAIPTDAVRAVMATVSTTAVSAQQCTAD